MEPESGAAFTQVAMGFVPIDRAQQYFNSRYVPKDAIDKIQIVTAANVDIEAVQEAIARQLPEEAQVHRPAGSTQLMQETLRSSEQGLWLTTLLTLLMAVFIVLNTFFMNVAERRRHLSIMRAVGATRRQIAASLIGEALLLGVLGTAIGMLAGVGVAFVVTYVLATAFSVELPRLVEVMSPQPFVVGAIFGLAMALVGAVVPAILAGRVSPLEGMNRQVNVPTLRLTALFFVVGLVLTGGALYVIAGSIRGSHSIAAAQYAAWPLLIGMVMLNSVVMAPLARFVASVFRLFAPVETGLALKQVLRHHTRSVLTVAVLFIVGSTVIGMGNSIRDNVRDVHEWYEQAIGGDYFIRAMMPDMATGTSADLPEGIGDDLEKVPHLASIDAAAFVEAKVIPAAPDAEPLTVIILCREFVERDPKFDVIDGELTELGEQLREGNVVLASVLAQKLNLTVGDTLPLETSEGVKQIPIAAVVNDYMVGGMGVHMHRIYAERWLNVKGVDGYMIKVDDGYLEEVRPALAAIAKKYDVMLMSHGDIRQTVERIVGGVEWSLWALVFLGFVVAAFGVVNTLTMNVLEQTRELGLLRIVAMTKRQVRRTIVMQALIIGGVGLPPGVLMGLGIAYVLNLAMEPSIGRPIDFHFYPDLLIGTLLGAVIIVLIAAIIPARRAAGLNVVDALHYE
jgi:putative ABC transport system permease protein